MGRWRGSGVGDDVGWFYCGGGGWGGGVWGIKDLDQRVLSGW